jgi:FKBP-type peptidyl-prolyl cis-trans isomerase FklB
MRIIKNTLAIALTATLFSCGNQVKEVKSLETELDSVSYAVGLTMSSQLKKGFDEVNVNVLTQAINNGLDSTNLLIEAKDIQNIIKTYFTKKQEEKRKEDLVKAEIYKTEGVAFLEANKTKEGVKSTKSGLQYIVLKEGTGKKPNTVDKVKVHYHGTTIDGTVFDSSVDKGAPAEFGVTQVIKGWTEGLQLMTVGSKYKFFIPQELAYGERPNPRGKIKPFMALIFEVELLEILK